MVQLAGPAPPPPADLMAELRVFIAGATRSSRRPALDPSLARTALSLLQTLPAAREAVLEYLNHLFDEAVSKHFSQLEGRSGNGSNSSGLSPQEEATISEIHEVLSDIVSNSPAAWAPNISSWALNLLGGLSTKYTASGHIRRNINDSLQQWMSCRTTRTLIDITALGVAYILKHFDTEKCISTLFEACVAHRPHFDWVVAHVGGCCFPRTVLSRVLSCGLEDFSNDQINQKTPNLDSVVNILNHLEGTHQADTRRALLQLFQWSLTEDPRCDEQTVLKKDMTAVFFVYLASISKHMLRALSMDVVQTLTPQILATLSLKVSRWHSVIKIIKLDVGRDLLNLALSSPNNAPTILKLVLDSADPPDPESVPTSAAEQNVYSHSCQFLEMLLQVLSSEVYQRDRSVPFLECLREEISTLLPLLLGTPKRAETALRLLLLLGHQSGFARVTAVSFLLTHAQKPEQLAMLVRLAETRGASNTSGSGSSRRGVTTQWSTRSDGGSVDTLRLALASALIDTSVRPENRNKGFEPGRLWMNLKTLLEWERSSHPVLRDRPVLCRKPVRRAVISLLPEICDTLVISSTRIWEADFVNAEWSHAVATVLEQALRTETGRPLELHAALKLAHSAVSFFFSSLEDPEETSCVAGCRLACTLLSRLCSRSSAARQLALRSLLERALFHDKAYLLGGKPMLHEKHTQHGEQNEFPLLVENLKQGLSWVVAQSLSSVFHAGVIGTGLRRPADPDLVPDSVRQRATQQVIDAVRACCTGSPDAPISVALLLVELVSPDVMYNGLPWPEEDACKATVERDCTIRRTLERTPLLWELLWWIAWHRPALCYCSVLLRAASATLVAQWGGLGGSGSGGSVVPVSTTVRLLSLLALGQLLPAPMASLRDVVPHLKPSEIVQILRDCVWNYMRDHVPSPALFSRDSSGLMWRDPTLNSPASQYTETMRLIMQANIAVLGPLYAQLFTP